MTAEISKRASQLWDRLRQWYGVRLAEQFGDDPPADWRRLVDRSSNEDIKRALAVLRTKHVSHPPTLLEFEHALKPPPLAHRDPHSDSVQEQLVKHVVATRRLTPAQLRGPWTFLYARRQWTDSLGRSRNELADCVGVVIPADGDAPEIRVTCAEMLDVAA